MSGAPPPLLIARGIGKSFPGVRALDGVDLQVECGEVLALCGENGAGKSTLIKILGGIHPSGSYEGDLLIDGQPQGFAHIADAETAGITVIHQELALVPDRSVAENIFLGREPTRCGLVDWARLYADAGSLLERFGIHIDPTARIGDLGTGRQQLVEIARALSKDSRILVLDEPTAALTEHEVTALLAILRDLRERGVAIIYISHKLDEVFAIADRITVLRDGLSVASYASAAVDQARLISDMVGRAIDDVYPPRQDRMPEDPLLTVAGLHVAADATGPDLVDLSFSVEAGEVLGIGGLMGAGRSELLLHLLGAWGSRRGGSVRLAGHEWHARNPRQAIADGVVLVSEDRKGTGLVLDQSVGFNLSLASLWHISRGLINRQAEARRNRSMADRLRVKTPSLASLVRGLSGGNQQKVVLGKALLTEPRLMLLDEPTRGIDVGAKQEVYRLLRELTAQGLAVIMVSSELPELIGMSDRILILGEGRAGGLFDAATASQEELLAAAIIGHEDSLV